MPSKPKWTAFDGRGRFLVLMTDEERAIIEAGVHPPGMWIWPFLRMLGLREGRKVKRQSSL